MGSPYSALFPDEDHRPRMGVARGSVAAYFGPSAEAAAVLAERSARPRVACTPEGAPFVGEALAVLREAGVLAGPPGDLAAASARLEPDLVVLSPSVEGPRIVAHAVCFPSAWAPEAKLGEPIDRVHAVVPGLETALGPAIEGFLTRLRPGFAWLRSGWGLARTSERDQHPSRGLPRLDERTEPADVWVRIEDQALVALPATRGVLFGIRVRSVRLVEVAEDPVARRGLARALRTMTPGMASYKGLAAVRDRVVAYLEADR